MNIAETLKSLYRKYFSNKDIITNLVTKTVSYESFINCFSNVFVLS